MAAAPRVEPPIYVEDLHRGDHHHYDYSDNSAAERRPKSGRETWLNITAIPSIPPALAPFPGGPVVGDVRGIRGVPLVQVPGNPYRYAYQGPPPQQFADMVPANYAGGAYQPALRDSVGRLVPYNPSVWAADGILSVVEFKYHTPQELGYAPPFALDYWSYVGPVASTSGALANDGTGAQVYEVGTSNPSLLRTLVADPGVGLGGVTITQNPTEIAIGNSLTGNNLTPSIPFNVGQVFTQKTAAQLDFRTIKAGTNVTVTETPTQLIISATAGGGGLSGLNNTGIGFDVYDVPSGATALLRRLNPGAGGISIAYAGVSGVNAYLDIDNTLTGANPSATIGAVGVWISKTGATLNFKSLVAGTGIAIANGSPTADDITITNTDGASAVTLASAGGAETLVNDGVGPALATKGLSAGMGGISLTGAATSVTIDNTLTGASLGGTAAVFANKTGATLNLRGISAGAGITVTQGANDITITNTDGASAVTLASAGGAETLVNDGVGPTLATKGLSAGTGGISLTGAATSVTIDNTLTGASLGGTAAVFANKTGATLNLRGISAGAGITVTQGANDITITNADGASTVTLASAGGAETLVNDGVGPTLATKGLSAGTGGISLTGAATSVTIDNTLTGTNLGAGIGTVFDAKSGSTLQFNSLAGTTNGLTVSAPAAGVITIDNTLTGASLGGTAAVFANKTGATLNLRGISAGTGITVTQGANDITITNADGASTVTLASAGGAETLVNDGVGPALATKGLSAGTGGISLTGAATSVTIDNTLTGASLGGTAAVFANKTGATLNLRGISAGTGITVTQGANDITITNADGASTVTLASAGGAETLVNDGVGPALATKGLSAGTGGISLTGAATSVAIDNTLTGASLGGTAAVFANKTGATLNLRGISAGTGITVTQGANVITITNADGASTVTLASAGGAETLVNDGVGPALATKGLSAGTGGISLTGAATSVTIDNTLTGASLGGTAAVFANKTGATLNLRGISAGTGITVTQGANDITITNADGASTVTLASAGGAETLVNDGVGPALATKGLSAGTGGISLTGAATSVTIDNTLTGASLGGTAAVFANKTGATLNLRGISAGTGITVTQGANDITITNADGASTVTLASAGGAETLVNDGVGPALATKGLSAGTGGISLTGAATSVTIDNTLTGASLGGTAAVFANKTGATLNLRGISAGTGITVTQGANDITITNVDGASTVTLASAGGAETLVNDGVGPALATKGLSAGTGGISLTGAATSVTIDNTLTGASLGGTAAVFANKTGATLNLRGISAGTGITVTQGANDITITNADGASTVTLASAGGAETLVNDGVGPALATKGLSAGTGGISLTGAATSVTIDNTLTGANPSVTAGAAGVWTSKTGVNLNFKSLVAGSGITITSGSPTANDITIAATGAGGRTNWTFWEQQAVGTNSHGGAGFNSGGWRTRFLTNSTSNGPTPLSIQLAVAPAGANRLLFQPGTYRVVGSAPAYSPGPEPPPPGRYIGGHQTRLQNITGSATLVLGTSETNNNKYGSTNRSEITGIFTITVANTVVELQHQKGSAGNTSNGFGLAAGFGPEVYSSLSFERLA